MHADYVAALSVSAGTVVAADGVEMLKCEPGGAFYERR
jgi:hypothetical protein